MTPTTARLEAQAQENFKGPIVVDASVSVVVARQCSIKVAFGIQRSASKPME